MPIFQIHLFRVYNSQHESDTIRLEGGGDREAKPPSYLQIIILNFFHKIFSGHGIKLSKTFKLEDQTGTSIGPYPAQADEVHRVEYCTLSGLGWSQLFH
jgi:hypothetical protein